jgi:hypothetical protein
MTRCDICRERAGTKAAHFRGWLIYLCEECWIKYMRLKRDKGLPATLEEVRKLLEGAM